ncbi:MAG: hypothetical protein K6F46_11215 [Desulfovibrio sp.]|nr:hypothetical protein [Desulfovibrio sp.]
MLRMLMVLLMTVFLPVPGALALSDSDYRALLQSSPEFRQAEAELSAAWKRALQSVKSVEGMAWRELRDDQRDWVAATRDEEARACMAGGMRKDHAYAKVTRDRAAYLNSFVR